MITKGQVNESLNIEEERYDHLVDQENKMKQYKFVLLTLIFSVVFQGNQVHADSEARPIDYAVITDDKAYIFVMLIPDEEIMRAWDYFGEEPTFYDTYVFTTEISKISVKQFLDAKQEPFSLRTKYPCSGLYKNDGSITPLWTVDWYAPIVYVYPDAEHLIRWDSIKRTEFDENDELNYESLAYAFYKNGIEVEKHFVQDVVKDTNAIHHSVSHYQWSKDIFVDKTTGLFHLETLDGQQYTYDIREMAKSITDKETSCSPNYKFSPYSRYIKPASIIVGSTVILGLLIFSFQTIRKRRSSTRE